MPKTPSETILVTGDVAIDWYELSSGQKRRNAGSSGDSNWKNYPNITRICRPGGAFLLCDAIAAATGMAVTGPQLKPGLQIEQIPANNILHSFTKLEFNKKKTLQVAEYTGFAGPAQGVPACLTAKNPCVVFPESATGAKMILIDDSGNGFRTRPELFPKDIADDCLVIYKAYAPLQQGGAWQWVKKLPNPQRVIVICAMFNLREIETVDISKGLSWEKTAMQFSYAIRMLPALEELRKHCCNLVVQVGTEAALIYRMNDNQRIKLVYDPALAEDDFGLMHGKIIGKGTFFTAGLASGVYQNGIFALETAVIQGLKAARRAILCGYEQTAGAFAYPWKKIFDPASVVDGAFGELYTVDVPKTRSPGKADPDFWSILDQKTANTRMTVAESIIRTGSHQALKEVPVLRCGDLVTVDRSEIERYGGIRALMQEYVNQKETQPLSIAVFGAPGSGKSFGVKQIAKFIAEKTNVKIETQTENISQYRDPEDLVCALHRTRDLGLTGKLPLVFFDEFDSTVGSQKLFWLKAFLAPMQDGEFLQGETVYHIGKAIFVFAGGTCASFEAFETMLNEQADLARNAKLPDFISRLKGYVNIQGPNPIHANDESYVIRRAMILRNMFERQKKDRTREIFGSDDKTLNIDAEVLRALLRVPFYRHGNRSLESIVKMSRLFGQHIFNQDPLPPIDQMSIHVDPLAFEGLLGRDFITPSTALAGGNGEQPGRFREIESATISSIARELHADYIRCRKLKKEKINVPENYDELPIDKQNSNISAAEDIPRKLKAIGCAVRRVPPGRGPLTPLIREPEIERLAEMEHERWMREQRLQGWTYGEQPDKVTKQTPAMIPYRALDEPIKEYDRESVLAIPLALAKAGFEIYRLQERETVDSELIEVLGRIIHDEYCQERKTSSETALVNPALVEFNRLPDDLRQANLDNARTIPDKLLEIGYRIRRIHPDQKPVKPVFSSAEIDIMARIEHDRWSWEKRLQGWTLGANKDVEKKVSPYLSPFDRLTPDIQDYDRQTVRLIPDLLSRAGYGAYKL